MVDLHSFVYFFRWEGEGEEEREGEGEREGGTEGERSEGRKREGKEGGKVGVREGGGSSRLNNHFKVNS